MNRRKDLVLSELESGERQVETFSHSEASNKLLEEAIQQIYEEPIAPAALYDSLALLLGFVEESARQFNSDDKKPSD